MRREDRKYRSTINTMMLSSASRGVVMGCKVVVTDRGSSGNERVAS
jgi:hypothetical protein